jgi:hypothetical protein
MMWHFFPHANMPDLVLLILTLNGMQEHDILDCHPRGRGSQFLVRWKGYGHEDDEWLAGRLLEDCEALDRCYEAGGDGPGSARYFRLGFNFSPRFNSRTTHPFFLADVEDIYIFRPGGCKPMDLLRHSSTSGLILFPHISIRIS